jgi:NADH-quinone oxidoreductase subunit J
LIELVLVLSSWSASSASVGAAGAPTPSDVSNTLAIGRVLYTKYVYFFQAAGLVLLTAMIGAIVLTLRHKPDVKRQVIADQNERDKSDVKLQKVPSRAGV